MTKKKTSKAHDKKELIKVHIGIQARSTSVRFPKKVFQEIGGKNLLESVIDSANRSIAYINEHTPVSRIHVKMNVLCPFDDEIAKHYENVAIEGPERDVLTRFWWLTDERQPDYIVRLTADCPLLPSFLITKAITTAVINGYDYISNVDERFRTAPDGWDVEVISAKAMKWLHENAKTAHDREHVTTLMRSAPPDWAKIGTILGYLDLSMLKLSIDTKEDLKYVQTVVNTVQEKGQKARLLLGPGRVHVY